MEVLIPEKLIHDLKTARKVAVLTGAGISAESGVPTFREAQTGLWERYDPQQLATPEAFKRNPRLVWDWYAWRRSLVSGAEPNNGHIALAQMAALVPDFTLITQNVDSLHQRAGSPYVIELHGNIMRIKCFKCGHGVEKVPESDLLPPSCVICGGLLRPDVVWFGENLPEDALTEAFSAARASDIFFSIGTSSLVQPAAYLPIEAYEGGAQTVEINIEPTQISDYFDYIISGPSGVILPALVELTWPGRSW